jgi:hypothetical protein
MQRLLFLIHAEHHLMWAASIIADRFHNKLLYDITILQAVSDATTRFRNPINLDAFQNVTYRSVQFTISNRKFNQELYGTVTEIIAHPIDLYFCFLEQHVLNIFFARKLKQRGTTICLAPDGTKPYGKVTKRAIFSRLYATFFNYRFLFLNKLYVPSLCIVDWNYGRMKDIDELWMSHAHAFQNITQKKIRDIYILQTTASRALVSDLFNFEKLAKRITQDRVIFYVNQPINIPAIQEFELGLLPELIERLGYTLVIKLHPNTPTTQLEKFQAFKKAEVISDTLPAELYIAKLTNSIVLSFWSGAALVNNTNCRFYWLHNVLRTKGLMIEWIDIINPTKHIRDVSDINEIV